MELYRQVYPYGDLSELPKENTHNDSTEGGIGLMDNEVKCFKCGIKEGEPQQTNLGVTSAVIIKHHINYDTEVLVDCCRSCHQKIHNKVRRNNTCKYSPAEVLIMSKNSSTIRAHKKYELTKHFREHIDTNIRLIERIKYNINTKNVYVMSWFEGTHGTKLYRELIS